MEERAPTPRKLSPSAGRDDPEAGIDTNTDIEQVERVYRWVLPTHTFKKLNPLLIMAFRKLDRRIIPGMYLRMNPNGKGAQLTALSVLGALLPLLGH